MSGNGTITTAGRAARLRDLRNLKMARSAHAYVRGSTAKFYEWLEESAGRVPEGPPIWICGDCHLGNLGPLADADGHVAIQIRDLDQTVIGNPAHDLVRLGLSLASAARGCDLPGVATALILESLMAGYETAMAGGFGPAHEAAVRPKAIGALLDRSVRRRWRHLADERLNTVEPVIPLGDRFWALAKRERAAIVTLCEEGDVRRMLTMLSARDDSDPVKLVDAAYWMKGCSSLGRLRYAAMVRIGKGKRAMLSLVDIKEATAAAAPSAKRVQMPRDNALRVVAGAQALSPNLGERMIAARLLDRSVILRELMPQDLKLEIDSLSRVEATALAEYLGGVVGRAHGRQMARADRGTWKREMRRARRSKLAAPSWLWDSVVELLGIHERAYLEHCHAYALAHPA